MIRWNDRRFRDAHFARRKSALALAARSFDRLERRALLATAGDVLSYRDGSPTGVNASETRLTPVNVRAGSFGKLTTTPVDGQVYAEPLVLSGVTIADGPNTTPGSSGVHDVVFVATEHDSLYAIDTAAGSVLWRRSFLDTGVAANNTLGASAIASVPNAEVGSADVAPEIGITGTPVIDPATGTLYLSAKTKETIGGATHYVQRLHAVNVADGADRVSPFLIGDTTAGNTNNTRIYVYGAGDGSVTDPYNGTGKKVVQFNAFREAQRQALSLRNGRLYESWASHGDSGPYHGWVVSWDVSNLATAGFKLSGVLNTSPNGGLAGIWGAGGELAFEPDDSTFYFETGNGPGGHGNPTLDANGFPTDGSYYEALVKAVADPATSPTNQNINGWGFKVADYFVPFNQVALDNADEDFGSASPLVLPDSAGIPNHPRLMIAAGKEGKIYLIDRDNLGKFDPNNDRVLNSVANGVGNNTPPVQIGGALSTPAYFNGALYYTSGYSSTSNAYKINANGTLTQTSQTPENTLGYLPGSVTVSADGTSNGVVWVTDRNANAIRAYDAGSMANELWNSAKVPGDAVGALVKFAVPTVSHGRVFVGTTSSLVVYGLTPPAGQAPAAPVLKATALSGTSVNLTWTDASVSPNTATGYLIDESTDGTTFTQITTAAANTAALAVGGLNAGTTYYFRIRGKNNVGTSPDSAVAPVATTDQVAALNFSSGFAGSGSQLSLNGSAALNGSKLELSSGKNDQTASVFSTAPVGVSRFSTQFLFQLTAGWNTADGFTFTIQGQGPTALGGGGGGLGYGTDGTAGGNTIGKSVAVKFDLYSNAGEGGDSTGLYTNGASPTNPGSIDLTGAGIDLHGGDLFLVDLNYDGETLAVTITDNVTGTSSTQSYPVDIVGAVGGTSAYVGFTAATGGLTATQDVLSWTYSPASGTAQAPNAPSGLGAVPATATTMNLTWTGNSTNQTGFALDRATDPGFTQGVVTQTLPASPNAFTDGFTGLAPGSTFYYRIRAFNAAGASANSVLAQVTIPLPPPKPSDLKVTGVTATQVDLSWVDNAGTKAHAYYILRKVGNGSFTDYATLPATSDVPGRLYTWSDTNVTPGTAYEYHVQDVNSSGNNDFVGTNLVTISNAPSGLSANAAGASVNLSWAAVTGAIQYNVYRGNSAGGEAAKPIAAVTSGSTYADTGLSAGARYFYTVTAVNANINRAPVLPSESAASGEASATTPTPPPTPSPVPAPWTGQDVGGPALSGSSSYSGGTFTVTGAGSDVWNTSDQFQFVGQPLRGDGTIVARVSSQTNTDVWAKAGVMIRASTNPASPHAFVTLTPGGGASFQSRSTTGGASQHTPGPVLSGPAWVKLTRSGNTFTGSTSSDGLAWTVVGTYSLPMGADVSAGLAVTSHNPSVRSTVTFDNVTFTQAPVPSLPSGWNGGDIGAPSIAGASSYSNGVFTVTGAGDDVWNRSDQFQFADQLTRGDTTVVARVSSQTNTDPWAKAGVMIRATTAANSAFVDLVRTPGTGLSFQWRSAAGAAPDHLQNVPSPSGTSPVWLKLVRRGSTFTGYASSDGVNYKAVGSISVSMASNTFSGLAVTSHNTGTSSTATFDNVKITSQ